MTSISVTHRHKVACGLLEDLASLSAWFREEAAYSTDGVLGGFALQQVLSSERCIVSRGLKTEAVYRPLAAVAMEQTATSLLFSPSSAAHAHGHAHAGGAAAADATTPSPEPDDANSTLEDNAK